MAAPAPSANAKVAPASVGSRRKAIIRRTLAGAKTAATFAAPCGGGKAQKRPVGEKPRRSRCRLVDTKAIQVFGRLGCRWRRRPCRRNGRPRQMHSALLRRFFWEMPWQTDPFRFISGQRNPKTVPRGHVPPAGVPQTGVPQTGVPLITLIPYGVRREPIFQSPGRSRPDRLHPRLFPGVRLWLGLDADRRRLGLLAGGARPGPLGTLVTAIFLHGGWAHVLTQLGLHPGLRDAGGAADGDRAGGGGAFFAFFLVCGVLGNLAFAASIRTRRPCWWARRARARR